MAAVRAHGPGATMAQVAAEAGVTKPVLYRHFADRDELVAALAKRYAGRVMTLVAASLEAESPQDPRVLLATTVDAYLHELETEPVVYRFLGSATPGASPEAAAVLTDVVHQLARRLARLLHQEFARFGLRTSGAEPIAHGVIGMVQATGEWWLAHPDDERPPRADVVDTLVRVLWAGLANTPSA